MGDADVLTALLGRAGRDGLVVAAGSFDAYMAFHQSGLPFSFHIVDAHTAVIEPIPGTPLPSALRAGDRIDLTTSPPLTRIAIIRAARTQNGVAVGRTYAFVIRRGGDFVTVPVTSIATPESGTSAGLMGAGESALLWLFALLALWRGCRRGVRRTPRLRRDRLGATVALSVRLRHDCELPANAALLAATS